MGIESGACLEDLFAPTPPLEALKLLMSMAVTEGLGWDRVKEYGMKLEFIDVRRAFFHADARREVYVALPEEDADEHPEAPEMCGRLNVSLYGT